jgi:Domain of unknown function (DUF4055)
MPVTANKGVRTTHPDYDKMAPIWKKCRDIVAGQTAVHAATVAYLPKLHQETDDGYKARLKRSDFFNGTWITVRAFVGMLFRKAPTTDVPKGIEPHLKDVTMNGKPDMAFAKALAHEALVITRFGLLVDHPPLVTDADGKVVSITVAAGEKMGRRPRLALYTAESITNWKPRETGKPGQYAMVTLKEEHPIPEDEYSHKSEPRYRVLDLDGAGEYRQRVFRIGDNGKDEQVGGDIYPLMNSKRLGYVPFKTFGADGEELEVDDPALVDLVHANEAVYQVNSDWRHGLHFAGCPTPWVAGYQKDEGETLYIGSTVAWVFPDPNAKAQYLEFTGQGLDALSNAVKEKKQEMAMAGARAIADETKQAETLGATQIKRTGENSALSNVAVSVSSAMEWALGVFAEWAGQPGEIVYQLNRDFNPMGLGAQELTALVGAVQAGRLSPESFFDLIQRGDIVEADLTFEEEQARIDASGPPAPAKSDPNNPPKEEAA